MKKDKFRFIKGVLIYLKENIIDMLDFLDEGCKTHFIFFLVINNNIFY